MPLRVGFDLDGTVADMYPALHREALKLFGEEVIRQSHLRENPAGPAGRLGRSAATAAQASLNRAQGESAKPDEDVPTNDAMQELHLTARQQTQLWDHVKKIDNFWSTLPELEPGIIARIAKAAVDRRWEVILFDDPAVNRRRELVQMQSQRWLEAHGFQYPSVYVVQRSRGKIADALALDAFVDDRPENCLDIAVESKAKVILVWHGAMTEVPAGAKRLGVQPVSTISEAMVLLERLDDIRNKPGLMRTIKRALGGDSQDS